MKQSAPHPVLAWGLDMWLMLSLVRLGVDAIGPDAARPVRMWWSIFGILLVFVLPIAYHAWWSWSARFSSFGELVFSRIRVEDRKSWLNPYGTSRVLLFGCAAYGVFMQWSVFPRHRIAGSFELPVELLLLGIAAGSMIVLGRGHAWALAGIVGYRALERTAHMPPLSFDSMENVAWFTLGIHGETIFFALVCAAVAHGYSAARGRAVAMQGAT